MTLVNRVSAFFLAALALVLAASSAIFYVAFSQAIYKQFDQRLYAALTPLAAAIEAGTSGTQPWQAWTLVALVLVGGLAGLIALARAGMRLFWSVTDRNTPRLSVLESAPLAFLILVCLLLTAGAGPAMRYFDAAARDLAQPRAYIHAVLGDPPATEARP